MNAPRVTVIGSANIDLITRVPRCPKPGESLIGTSFARATGGKGASQAVAAGRLGARVAFIGRVGDDAFGGMQRDSLAASGVDVSRLAADANEPTGTAVILVGDDGQNSIIVTPAANNCVTPACIASAEDLIARSDVVLLQLEIPLESVEAALDIAKAKEIGRASCRERV